MRDRVKNLVCILNQDANHTVTTYKLIQKVKFRWCHTKDVVERAISKQKKNNKVQLFHHI